MDKWKLAQFYASRKGAMGGGIIAVTVAVIIVVAAGIPVVTDVVNNATLNASGEAGPNVTVTGTTATILNQLPIFIALAGLVMVAAMFS